MTNHSYIAGVLLSRIMNGANVAHTNPGIVNACITQMAIIRPRLGLLALSDEA